MIPSSPYPRQQREPDGARSNGFRANTTLEHDSHDRMVCQAIAAAKAGDMEPAHLGDPAVRARAVPFTAWILRVARNVAIDQLRQRRSIRCEEVFEQSHKADDSGRDRRWV